MCVYIGVFSLSVVSPLAKFVGNWKVDDDEVRWRRSKGVFRIRSLLQHGIWFAFVLQDSWSLGLLVLRRNGVMRCWEGSMCCRMWEIELLRFWRKICRSYRNWTLDVTVSFVSGMWRRVCVISMWVESGVALRST